ncbi:MAG: hypothetical protein WCI51_01560 [Lentisphaerota bacterium]
MASSGGCSVIDHLSMVNFTDGKPCDTFSLIGLRDIFLQKKVDFALNGCILPYCFSAPEFLDKGK